MAEDRPNRQDLLQVDLHGKTPQLWEQLHKALYDAVFELLAQFGQPDERTNDARWTKGAGQLLKGGLDALRHRLDREGILNRELEAQIEKALAEREVELANARKVHAEAEAVELQNSARRLLMAMKVMSAVATQEADNLSVVFGGEHSLASLVRTLEALAAI